MHHWFLQRPSRTSFGLQWSVSRRLAEFHVVPAEVVSSCWYNSFGAGQRLFSDRSMVSTWIKTVVNGLSAKIAVGPGRTEPCELFPHSRLAQLAEASAGNFGQHLHLQSCVQSECRR